MPLAAICVIVVISVISAIIVAIAIVMLRGRGAYLFADFWFKEEKEKCDRKKLSKFLGKIVLTIGISFNLITVGVVIDFPWMAFIVVGLVFGLILFAEIYCTTRGRFKK